MGGSPDWTSSSQGRDQHYKLSGTFPVGKTFQAPTTPSAGRSCKNHCPRSQLPEERPRLAVDMTFLPLSQPLSSKRLSLAHLPIPLWTGRVAGCLGGQATHIQAWLSLLFPGLEFPSQENECPAALAKASSTRQGQAGGGASFQHRQEVSQEASDEDGRPGETTQREQEMLAAVRTVRA